MVDYEKIVGGECRIEAKVRNREEDQGNFKKKENILLSSTCLSNIHVATDANYLS